MGLACHRYEDTKDAFVAHAQKTAGIFVVVLLVWALSGFGFFWPAWVLLGLGLSLGNHARRVYGVGSRADEADERDEQYV